MGCIKSKIDPKICQRDKTHSLHVDFIKKHGLQKYYQTLGMEPEEQHNSYEDNSKITQTECRAQPQTCGIELNFLKF